MNQTDRIRKNPGNIRAGGSPWPGEVTPRGAAFKHFSSWPYGYRALLFNLRRYFWILKKKDLSSIIHLWAPPSENNTARYLAYVAARVNWPATMPIPDRLFDSPEFLGQIAASICVKEVGWDPPLAAFQEGINLLQLAPDGSNWKMWNLKGDPSLLIPRIAVAYPGVPQTRHAQIRATTLPVPSPLMELTRKLSS